MLLYFFLLISFDTFNSTATALQIVAFSCASKERKKLYLTSFTDNELNHVAVNQQLIVYNMNKEAGRVDRQFVVCEILFSSIRYSLLCVVSSDRVSVSRESARDICCQVSSVSF